MLALPFQLLLLAVVSTAAANQCGQILLQHRSGELKSHKQYGTCNHPVSMRCAWDLEANPEDSQSRLAFHFQAYEMPLGSKDCAARGTSLRVFADKDESKPPLFTFCSGFSIPPDFTSTTNRVRLVLHTRDFATKGFFLKWTIIRPCAAHGDFHCHSGECIAKHRQCDGVVGGVFDCQDHSDEIGCSHAVCNNETELPCAHKLHCYPKSKRCDGKSDCRDGSDEKDCSNIKCNNATEFRCVNQPLCISRELVCDGKGNCPDNSDEARCSALEATCDPKVTFRCTDKLRCISHAKVCDGVVDCRDGSDESRCIEANCRYDTEFRCAHKLTCIPVSRLCDGRRDCSDNSDESMCSPCGEIRQNGGVGELRSHMLYGTCTYPMGMRCSWDIVANANNRLSRLVFHFTEYEMPLGDHLCSGDVTTLKVFTDRDESRQPLRTFCSGRTIPGDFVTITNQVRLVLQARHFATRGFVLKWSIRN